MSNGEQPIFLYKISPKLYRYIITELETNFHIQPYDVQLEGNNKDEGIKLIVRFGENFNHSSEQFFSNEQLENEKLALKDFIAKTGGQCIQVLKDDYFNKMTP